MPRVVLEYCFGKHTSFLLRIGSTVDSHTKLPNLVDEFSSAPSTFSLECLRANYLDFISHAFHSDEHLSLIPPVALRSVIIEFIFLNKFIELYTCSRMTICTSRSRPCVCLYLAMLTMIVANCTPLIDVISLVLSLS